LARCNFGQVVAGLGSTKHTKGKNVEDIAALTHLLEQVLSVVNAVIMKLEALQTVKN
jgi:formylmethanofuran dehydrogenase subunit B